MNKHLGYKEFEIAALNSLRISNNIDNIDTLDSIVFNLIKFSDGQKITSNDVKIYLKEFNKKDDHIKNSQVNTINVDEKIFNQTLKEGREEFEKLYFKFHMQKKISVSELAGKSGVERTHLYRKLKSLGIKTK